MSHLNSTSPLPGIAAEIGIRRRIARALRWSAAIMAATAILIALSVPSSIVGWLPDVPSADKLLHTGVFAPLMILWCVAVRAQWPQLGRVKLMIVVGSLVTLYGVYGEFHQLYFAKGRSFSVWDMVFNALGVVIGAAAWWWWQRRRNYPDSSGPAIAAEPETPSSPL